MNSFRFFRSFTVGVLLLLLIGVGGSSAQQEVPQPAFLLTDSEPSSVLLDPQRNQMFVSIAELNRIDVYSLSSRELVDRIDIASPAGMDLTLDGTRLIVGSGGRANLYAGSGTQFLSVLDPVSHRILDKYYIPALPGELEDWLRIPHLVAALPDDNVAILAGTYDSTATGIIKLDLKTGVFTRVTLPVAMSPGNVRRVGNTSRVWVSDISSSGRFIVLDTATEQVVGDADFSGYFVFDAAISPDGNRIAVKRGWNELHMFDGQLNDLGIVTRSPDSLIRGLIFSPDSKRLYVAQEALGAYFDVFDSATLSRIGQVPGALAEHGMAFPVAFDPAGLIIAQAERGLFVLDASVKQLSGLAPGTYFQGVTPPSGTIGGGTAVSISSVGFTLPSAVYVGGKPAPQFKLRSSNTLDFMTPQASKPGPQDVVVDFLSGWRLYIAQGFSYGPTILYRDMTAGPVSGGAKIHLIGYGFASDAANNQVTIGGRAATVDGMLDGPGISPWILPTKHLYITAPEGTSDYADLTLRTPNGVTTIEKAFRYYSTAINGSVTPLTGNILFDPWRNRIYASSVSNGTIDVIDAKTLTSLNRISVQAPLGMCLSPDGAQLVVASQMDELVVIDATTFAARHIPMSFPYAYGRAEQVFPETVAVTSTGKALVGVPDFDLLDNAYLVEVDLTTGEQNRLNAPARLLSYLDLRQLDGGNRILLSPLGYSAREMVIWNAASRTFGKPHQCPDHVDVAVTEQAEMFACGRALMDSDFRWTARARTYELTAPRTGTLVYGLALHPGGSLLLEPHADSLWVFDTNTGKELQRIALPASVNVGFSGMAISADGAKAFFLTDHGILALPLEPLPLSVGIVKPDEVSSGASGVVIIRGSGFQPGVSVSIGDDPVAAEFVNSSTLQVTVPALPEGRYAITVLNLDGARYTKQASLMVYGKQPVIKGTTPSTLDANVGDVQIEVFGLAFRDSSVVQVNGSPIQTSRTSDTSLRATIPAVYLKAPGSVSLTVSSGDGWTSQALNVPVKYPPGNWGIGTNELTFGLRRTGEPVSLDFEIGNSGRGPLFKVSIGLDAPAFAQTNNCPPTLQPFEVCKIHLTLDTSSARNADGVLHLGSESLSQDVRLLATVIPPGPYMDVSNYALEQSGFLGDPVAAQFSIHAYDTDVTITSIRATSPDVSVNSNCAKVTTLGCNFTLVHVPTKVGKTTITGVVESDASNSPVAISTEIEGRFPLKPSPDFLQMGGIFRGNTVTHSLEISNYGERYTAKIENVTATGPFTAVSKCGATLGPRSRCTVEVSTTADTLGPRYGIVTVTTADGDIAVNVAANVIDFELGVANGQEPAIVVNAGETGRLPFSLVGKNGFRGYVSLSCESSIPRTSCFLKPAMLQVDSSGALFESELILGTTKASSSTANRTIVSPSKIGSLLIFATLLLGVTFLRPDRTSMTRVLIALGIVCLGLMVACGGGGGGGGGSNPPNPPPDTGTPAGTYTITVKASFSVVSPPIVKTANVNVQIR